MQKQYTNSTIQQDFQRLGTMSEDERLRRLAETNERALINERLSRQAARAERSF